MSNSYDRSVTVLVVDDDERMLRYLKHILELDAYRVETASSGAKAVERLAQGLLPDVVLLDVQMPGMDGLETLQRLLQLRPGLKVIMCSGTDAPRIVLEALVQGAQDYLTKPLRHLYLSAALDRCLASAQQV